jgi:hypothetical protein
VSPSETDTLFIVGPVGGGLTSGPGTVTDMESFVGLYTDRTVAATVPLYDALDGFFNEGGARAVVGGYAPGSGVTYDNGLALLDDKRLGPGQLSLIGTAMSGAVDTDLAGFLSRNNRVGLFDVNNGDSVAQMTTDAAYMAANSDSLAMFGSWVEIPGPSGVIGASARTIPASPIIGALCARVDADGNPNRAAGGRDYPLKYVDGFVLDPTDTQRETLLGLGVNLFTDDYGVLINAGFQTNIPQSAYQTTPFWQLNCARARMWLKAKLTAVAANYYMRPIDGSGRLAAQLQSDCNVVCKELYDANGLFGATPADAYNVTVSSDIESAAQGAMTVSAQATFSMYCKSTTIDLAAVPVTVQIAA